jgi:hypothetical protein
VVNASEREANTNGFVGFRNMGTLSVLDGDEGDDEASEAGTVVMSSDDVDGVDARVTDAHRSSFTSHTFRSTAISGVSVDCSDSFFIGCSMKWVSSLIDVNSSSSSARLTRMLSVSDRVSNTMRFGVVVRIGRPGVIDVKRVRGVK